MQFVLLNRLFPALVRPSVELFELGVRTPGGLFLGVWYARGIDFRHMKEELETEPKISGMGKHTTKCARMYLDY